MDQDQEKKHACKLCNKSFLSGRLLSGHMRIHVLAGKGSAKEEINLENGNMGIEGYGLRENPKKSWKFSGLKNDNGTESVEEIMQCRVCGKQFESQRSLHGHMRHCSEKKGICCKECGRGFKTLRSLTGHMRLHSDKYRVSTKESRTSSSRPNLVVMALSDTDTVSLVRKKRSNRIRYKVTPNSSFSSLNESISGFEVEQEVEEVAMCLMMLSRGVCDWDEFKSVSESLDNGSVYSGDKSLYQNKRNERSEDGDCVFEGNEFFKKKKPRGDNLDPFVSDSKDLTYECSKLKFPIGSFYQEIDSKKLKLEEEFGFLPCDTDEIEKGIEDEIDSNRIESESTQEFTQEVDLGSLDAELVKDDSYTEIISSTSDFDNVDNSKKKSQFRCKICNKLFSSHQALGGHQTFHRTTRNSVVLKIEQRQEIQSNCLPEKIVCIKDSVEEEVNRVTVTSNRSKKRQEYKCDICSRSFISGQALGGHKRAHHSKPKEEQSMAIKEEAHNPNISNALHINLRDMLDEENSHEIGFNSCWGVSSYKHDPLLNLVAN
ncbi:hypothetical protein JCGZ_19919 [Jatropha curcas]|uniref:C2H2-type domain-containing protein n=1 Tax=Jatropha curcas TaxID=180498 RepID=A0A067K4S1_JATCU|nr:hypothetical protein JCGZ_19919 [Jatropha curcas]